MCMTTTLEQTNYLKELAAIKQAEQYKELCNRAINALMCTPSDVSEARYCLYMVSRGLEFTIQDLDTMRGLA